MLNFWPIRFVLALCFVWANCRTALAGDLPINSPAVFVRTLLESPAGEMDFARIKLALDTFVDPTTDAAAVLVEVDAIGATVEKMLSTLPPEAAVSSLEKVKALRIFLYDAGWWNGGQPFGYDLTDPFGQKPGSQLLASYLRTRMGNCVSMPALFVTVGERLGLKLTLSTAPLHMFVKWTDDSGKIWNLETTSGAGFTRDAWYRQKLPMTEEAVSNGVYLKMLSRREAVSVMATAVVDHLISAGRYEEAIDVADMLISAYPANAYALVKKGTAYYRLLDREFIRKYPKASEILADKIAYANELYRANQDAFAHAEALGWREPNLD